MRTLSASGLFTGASARVRTSELLATSSVLASSDSDTYLLAAAQQIPAVGLVPSFTPPATPAYQISSTSDLPRILTATAA